jgi:hypothetical protein
MPIFEIGYKPISQIHPEIVRFMAIYGGWIGLETKKNKPRQIQEAGHLKAYLVLSQGQ